MQSVIQKKLKIGEEEIMKKFMVCLGILVLILGFGGMAGAAPVTFTFDRGIAYDRFDFLHLFPHWDGTGLRPDANPGQISTYMSGIYGAPVTVAATGNPASSGLGLGLLGSLKDGYLESEQGSIHTIKISFSVPITSVSFDWARLADPFYADYSLNGTVFTNFFSDTPSNILDILDSGSTSFTFPGNVVALSFHDGGLGEIGIDNLVVTPAVPEPATMLLLGSGLVGFAGYARRRFKK